MQKRHKTSTEVAHFYAATWTHFTLRLTPVLRADLHSIKSVAGPTGNRRLVSDGETDGHADRFWAGALAVSSAETEYQPYAYRPVPAGGGRDVRRPVRQTAGFRAQKGVW